jgi:C4-dicarboxylate-specific signal transduction histidine kinase
MGSRYTPPEVKPVEVITIEKPALMYHPPLPNQIKALPVEWKVLTPDTMEEYLNDLREGEAPSQAWYGLTTKGYENLSNNMGEVKRYIRQVISIIEYYRKADDARQNEE